jgi:fatty-acid desaturase
MLELLEKIDQDRDPFWHKFDTFMYGYLEGIRAERARRKKVAL